jgi:hypothetical protein
MKRTPEVLLDAMHRVVTFVVILIGRSPGISHARQF